MGADQVVLCVNCLHEIAAFSVALAVIAIDVVAKVISRVRRGLKAD
jgi:hypothetical protein